MRFAAEKVKRAVLDIAGKTLEIDPADLEIVDGEVIAKGVPDQKMGVPDVAGAATFVYGELISGKGTALKPYATVDPETGRSRSRRTPPSRTRPAWPTSRSTTRRATCAC